MLSIGRLGTTGGADYYLDKVANSVDDYYLGRGEAPGQWIGSTSAELGLTGQVDPEGLRHLLAGRSADGQSLGLRLRADRRPGYDLTFSAPKGVSLLWAFGSTDVLDAVSSAHDRAVEATIDQLSAEACFARRGAGGQRLVEAEGFVGAAFRHRTSRAGDPQLHTHVVVPNLVRGEDGTWSAPDGRHLYAWAKTAGTLYQSALRAELAPLGLSWEVRRSGLSELSRIPKPILRAFSTRRADIEAAMEARGASSHRAARSATLATRSRKPDGPVIDDVLRAQWQEQLSAIELPGDGGTLRPATVADVAKAVTGEPAVPPGFEDVRAVFRVLLGEHGVSLEQWEIDESKITGCDGSGTRAMPVTLLGSTFTRRDAVSAVARAFDVTPAEAVVRTAALLQRDGVVRVLSDPGVGPDQVRTRRGQIVRAASGDRRYTTTELLDAEERIVAAATGRLGTGCAQVRTEIVDGVLARRGHLGTPRLDTEQASGLRQLLSSGNGYDVVIGQAGTGKSTMLGAARVAWEEAGFRVVGTAVAARTAADLERGTGIPSSSLTQLLADLRESGGLTSRHVVVVDEASMVGTRSLDPLRASVDTAGAKLVLVGDNRQLSSIDAGGALRTLSVALGDEVVTLTTNRRQRGADQQWEREALVALREGDVVPAVEAYSEHGRVTIVGTVDEARQRIVEDWWAVRHPQGTEDQTGADQTAAILAVRRSDVDALNDLVRVRRQAAGELGEQLRIGPKAFSVGDRVIFERNQRVPSAGADGQSKLVRLRNGTFGTVVGITTSDGAMSTESAPAREGDVSREAGEPAGGADGHVEPEARRQEEPCLVVELDDRRQAVLPRSYAETSTSLGYALTVFRSQGITVDHTFGLGGDTLFQEAGYTQLSRGRLSNNLYVTAPENPRWEIGHHVNDLVQRDALRSLVDGLSQSREQTMARDTALRLPPVTSEDLAAAFRRHESLGAWLAEHAPADTTHQPAVTRERSAAAARTDRSRPGAGSDVTVRLADERRREAWVSRHRSEIETWAQLDSDLRHYEYRLGQAAAYCQPDHTTAVLGPLPDRITGVERWQSAAGAIEAYRRRWGVDTAEALGPEPLSPQQRAHWHRVIGVVESARSPVIGSSSRELGRPWLPSMWGQLHALDEIRRDVTGQAESASELANSRDRNREAGRDQGNAFGL